MTAFVNQVEQNTKHQLKSAKTLPWMNSEAILNSSSAKNSPKADVRSSSSHKKSSSSSRSSVSGGDHREKSREKSQKHHEKAKINSNSDMIKVMEMSSAAALEPTIPAVVPPPPPERSSQKFRENENSTVAAVVAASRKPSATSNSSANSREIEINKPQFYFGQTMTDVVKKSSIGKMHALKKDMTIILFHTCLVFLRKYYRSNFTLVL